MTETIKSLPEIYRKAAELVETHGKHEGHYGAKGRGFCTMGAVIFAAGHMALGEYPELEIETAEFARLIKPVASRLVESGRRAPYVPEGDTTENENLFCTVFYWNDRHKDTPTAADVAALLRETADAVEVTV